MAISAAIGRTEGRVDTSWDAALAFIFKVEGGFVDNPADPGGMTNLGITWREWQDWVGGDFPVTRETMEALTKADVTPIYHSHYWLASRCQDMPVGVDLFIMDEAVNEGCGRAARDLQHTVGAKVDGIIGPVTLAAVRSIAPVALIGRLADTRLSFYRSLPTWSTFGHGWSNRVQEAVQASTALIQGATA
jgi:lysozyme family protein